MKPYHRLRRLIQAIVLRPLMIGLGLTVTNRKQLDMEGPAIVVANHNSHADTAALLAAFPSRVIPRVRPAAAADYFLRNGIVAWATMRIVGIVPVNRSGGAETALRWCGDALRRGDIVIIFPEGTRGEPGRATRFRRGVAVLAADHPGVPIIPVHIEGAADVLPKGSWLPVPLGIQLVVGDPVLHSQHEPIDRVTRRIEEAVWNLAA